MKLLAAALGCAVFGMLPLAQTAAAQGAPASHRVVVLGDSLSAGYGLAQGTGWVALLDRRLKERQPDYSVANASISGDTTAGDSVALGFSPRKRHATPEAVNARQAVGSRYRKMRA